MVTVILIAFGLGIGTALAGVRSYSELMRRHADAKLTTDNAYLQSEVKRLRGQVALHIGKEDYAPYVFDAAMRKGSLVSS